MTSRYKSIIGLILILPGVSFAQGKLNVHGAKINVMNAAYLTAYDVSMTDTSKLTVNNSTLRVADSIYSSSNINLRYGTLDLFGTNAQVTPASPFVNNAVNDLIVSNTSATGITLGGAADIYNSLTYSGTGMTLNTNDNLTFKSTSTNTAWLGDMTGNTITGKAMVEWYISSHKAWRFLSIPTNTTQTVRQTWQEGATSTGSNPVTGYGIQLSGSGGTAAGFDLYSALPSMKTYNSATDTWVGISSTSNTIKATDGYMTFVRGDRTANSFGSTVTQTTLRTKGALYTGDQAAVLVSAGKFASIGNPYASALDMRNITKTGVKDFFYVWDPNMAGAYGYGAYQVFSNDGSGNYVITPGGGSYGASGSISDYIASGLAFFVQGDVGGGSLTFKEGAKTTGSGVSSIAAVMPQTQLRANLYGINADSSTYITDGILINYNDTYSDSVDDMDAIKPLNTSENLAVKTSGKLLVVERRHTITDKDTIFFNLTGVSVRKYRFKFLSDQLYRPGLSAFLLDNYLHTSTPLYIDGTTDIDFTVTNVAGSRAPDRFKIVFSQLGTLPVTFTSVKAYLHDKNINVEWKVDNEMNIKQYETEKSRDGNLFTNLSITAATGNGGHSASYLVTDAHPAEGYNYYRVKSVDDNGKTAYSNLVKVMTGVAQQDITIYPNPVSNGIIRLQINNQAEGKYGIRLLSKSGQVIMKRQVEHTDGSSTETIQLDKYTPRGIYQLEVVKPDGNVVNMNVIY